MQLGEEVQLALFQIAAEFQRAVNKHPNWPTDVIHQAAIVGEESGELIRAALQESYEHGHNDESRKEAVQTGAMALRFLAGI